MSRNTPIAYLKLAREIAAKIRETLIKKLKKEGFKSSFPARDQKAPQDIDKIAEALIKKILSRYPVSVYLENQAPTQVSSPHFSVYCDPIDGSTNWERDVGSPCVVLAFSEKPKIACLDDLSFAYVVGLRTADEYWADRSRAYFHANLTQKTVNLLRAPKCTLNRATAYLRPGYGFAKEHLSRTLKLYETVKDIRAIENTGMELCEIARGAAHVLVEARGVSDGFNLLAWPVLRAVGGVITSLEGKPLTRNPIDLTQSYNFIAASHLSLAKSAAKQISPRRAQ